ncbi:hypothetical protein NHX12_023770, partial [Muraenolepis orangiensis]
MSEVPAAAASLARHVRNKRCSCASFLDKECVYFCHLDIIWVNTPERVVSYGLGNMPRKRRSVGASEAGAPPPRCRCLRGQDSTCSAFCQPSDTPLRYGKTVPSEVDGGCSGPGCTRATPAAVDQVTTDSKGGELQKHSSGFQSVT